MERLKQLAGIINEVEIKTTNPTDMQFIIRDLAKAYGENFPYSEDFKKYTIGQIFDDWVKLKSIKEDATSAPAPVNAPSDVKALGKAQSTATSVANKAKAINSINEFPGAFENWFKTLGFQPGRVSKNAIRSSVEKILTNLGYK